MASRRVLRATRQLVGASAPSDRGQRGRPGLFGLPDLHRPPDLLLRASRAQARCSTLVAEVASLPPSVRVLHRLDDISRALCSVLDVTALVQAVHPDVAWVRAADEASAAVGQAMAVLNTDRRLYDALQRVRHSATVAPSLSVEQRRFADLLAAEFEADGVHLPAGTQARVHALQQRVAGLSVDFMAELSAERPPTEPGGGDGELWVDVALVSRLPGSVLRALPRRGREALVSTDDPAVCSAVLKWAPDASLRERVWRRAHSRAPANVPRLAELLRTRAELARTLGFASHADMALAYGRMATSTAEIEQFLGVIGAHVRPKMGAELALMEAAAAQMRARGGAAPSDPSLRAWDVPFLTGQLKASAYELDGSALSHFFELRCVLAGLSGLVRSLFGLSLHELTDAERGAEQLWAPHVLKLALCDAEGAHGVAPGGAPRLPSGARVLGHLYLDLFARPAKHPVSATYTVSCGEGGAGREPDVAEPAVPVVAIACSFGSAPAAGAPTLLSHGELVTLHHELGHALHALLGATEFQHLSGVRGPTDFVECPALLLERFALDWRVVSGWATHVRTGAVVPRELLQRLKASGEMFAGYDLSAQLVLARADLLFHSASPPLEDSTAAMRALHEATYGRALPWVEGTHWHAQFSHVLGYAAGYYAYLWCKVLAAQLWEHRFAHDPLSRAAGDALREHVLAPGNAREPAAMLGAALGGAPLSLRPFLAEHGLLGAQPRDDAGGVPPLHSPPLSPGAFHFGFGAMPSSSEAVSESRDAARRR